MLIPMKDLLGIIRIFLLWALGRRVVAPQRPERQRFVGGAGPAGDPEEKATPLVKAKPFLQ